MIGLRNQYAVIHTHDAPTLAKYNLKVLGILFALCRDDFCKRRWLYLIEVDDAPFCLGDDFLGHDEYITLLKFQLLGLHGCKDNITQVYAWGNLANTSDRYNMKFCAHMPPVAFIISFGLQHCKL